MTFDIITIFPRMLDGIFGESMMKRAVGLGAVTFRTIDLRDFTTDKHRTTDDRPYGGGPGMVMKADPIFQAVESVRTPHARILLMSPQGRRFAQSMARELGAEQHVILVCGHYEGIDERVKIGLNAEEVSIGDYVLTNGVLPAAVIVDAVVRLLPGVLGGEGAAEQESFTENLLDCPHYTRPKEYRGMKVPEVLLSGDHGAIRKWREAEARRRTLDRRPDLLGD
ncbi:MAG: tRNA (guanosine(37)-N1)-methyltransferase TrmD [Kiritimatiellae bacterium]|nr:tRNA (guanosine(37)-N1)-methyltransferase TrmD [Kiritimatiellia bacterium]